MNNDLKTIANQLGKIIQRNEVKAISPVHWNPACTTQRVPWHTEGMYLPNLPSYLVFGCVNPGESGGKTLLLDGEKVLTDVLRAFPSLENVQLEYRKENNMGRWPVKGVHPRRQTHTLWFRDDPTNTRVMGENENTVSAKINAVLASLPPTYAHAWKEGDILVVDNHRMLHAREAYRGNRLLQRIIVE